MFNIVKKEIAWNNATLTLESGKIARQADCSVVATIGGTKVLACVVAQKTVKDDIDFLPLTVFYREMSFATGKIPGGFLKREGRPSERETLISRLIDRSLRPLFPDNFYNEVQIVCTLLSCDLEHQPDVVAMIAASAALSSSCIPFNGPVAGTRVSLVNDKQVGNPSFNQVASDENKLDLFVAGTKSSVLMVESEARELSEEQMLAAVEFGHDNMQPVIEIINEFANEVSPKKMVVIKPDSIKIDQYLTDNYLEKIKDAYLLTDKKKRREVLDTIIQEITEYFVTDESISQTTVLARIKHFEKKIVREDIMLATGKRIDNREFDQVRQIESEVSILPRTHGSCLFTRGQTQALAVATLGSGDDSQLIDDITGEYRERFILHYNFPSYSVGEVYPMRSPGRREIGHGKLAWRALANMLPTKDQFPYTLRLVSEITESNGSSSMATVCASSLAMMDAGVPLKSAVAGIAMGLILKDEKYIILSDISGDEDHLGDMDFKVAGTKTGVTALQMDIKIEGITIAIMKKALEQAGRGRMHILNEMAKSLTDYRAEQSEYAPTIQTMKIDQDKIRNVIGVGGKVIRLICEESGAKVEIEDDGTIKIAAVGKASSDKAIEMINNIITDPKIGEIYDGKVSKIVDFGAFIGFLGSNEGLVHSSELSLSSYEKISDVVKENDNVKIKVLDIDRRGKIRLSMRCVDQTTGDDISGQLPEGAHSQSRPRREGGNHEKSRKNTRRSGSDDRRRNGGGNSNKEQQPYSNSSAKIYVDESPKGDKPKRKYFS